MIPTRHAAEEARIRLAYARRKQNVPSDRYALHRAGALPRHASQLDHVARALRNESMLPFEQRRILDVGCGYAQWLVDFESMGAQRHRLAGIDLDLERLRHGRRRLCAERNERGEVVFDGADFRLGSAADLPWADHTFDIVFQSTLFTSILDPDLKTAVANEMSRVVKPDGLILWYDFAFNNPANSDVRGIGRRELRSLFPGRQIKLRRVTLAPPLGRRLSALSFELTSLLERLRLLNTHLLATIRNKPGLGRSA